MVGRVLFSAGAAEQARLARLNLAGEVPSMHYSAPFRDDDRAFPMRTVMWLLANPVDCDALALWCRSTVRCDRVDAFAKADVAFAHCERAKPKLFVVDPKASESAVTRAIGALHAKQARHVLVLDRRPREGALVEILHEPAASYLSRNIASEALAAAIDAILAHGTRAIDPDLLPRLRRAGRGYEFRDEPAAGSVASLTIRERQVMRLLAQGLSVRQCATKLKLATSTIDNHKARLMKKLDIHKASELTCIAVREGLIVP
jgi:two-component system secretion response regulator SsrB